MAHRLGITSIHDVVPISAWQAYQRAHRKGRLQLRVYAMVPGAATASLAQGGIQSGLGDEWLRVGAVKVFSDGSLGARTAALASPYETQVEERGMWIHPPSELWAILETAHQAGLQTATHAIGDAAVRLVSETLDGIDKENPRESLRHRIEHYELPDDDVLRRTKEAGLVPPWQPNIIGQRSGPPGGYQNPLRPGPAGGDKTPCRIVRPRVPPYFRVGGVSDTPPC